MKHMKYSFLFIILLCMLPSCGKREGNLKEIICSPNKSITELASKKYNNSELSTISQLKVSIDELNKQYPIYCLRESGDAYRVSYLGNDCVAVVYFDNSGNWILGKVCKLYSAKSDFNDLTTGMLLENVQEIDPHGEYLFLYTGRVDTPKISTHYTKDGYLITIEYDEKNTISNVTTTLI